MAPVNPPINPTNDPTYGQNSRAIDTPDPIRVQGVQTNQIMPEGQKIGDRSAEYLGQAEAFKMQGEAAATKGWGDLFSNIVGMGDFLGKAGVQMVKKDIENRVYEVADRERQQYTSELEQMIAGKVGTKNLLDANASMDTPLPEDISELPDHLATLQSAQRAGKITKLDYQGRLLEHAKALRSQYPGFKQEIDSEFAKVTGQNPANARVNSLITTINAQAAAASSSQNKLLTFIKQHQDVPNADVIYRKVLTGEMGELEAFTRISKYSQAKEELKARALIDADKTATKSEAERNAKMSFDVASSTAVAGAADILMTKLGMTSPAEVQKLEELQKNGGIPQAKWNDLNTVAANSITELRTRMYQQAVKAGLLTKMGGAEELNKKIAEAIKPLEAIQDRITNKSFGGMYEASREATELVDVTKRDLYKDSEAGPIFRAITVAKESGGEQYLQRMMLDMAFDKDPKKSPPKAFEGWFKRWSAELETQASKGVDGKTRTYNSVVEEMKRKDITDPKTQSQIMGNLVTKIEKIGQKDVPDGIKEKLIESAFSSGNNKFLSKLEMDTFDERGRPISGMHSVYQRWTSENVSAEVHRLSKSKPELWAQYTGWSQSTFSDEIVPREIATLSKYQKDPNIRIDWDTENKRFEVSKTAVPELQGKYRENLGGEGKNSAETIANIQQFDTVRASVNRINSALSNLKGMAAIEGGSDPTKVDAFLIRAITNAAGPDAIKNVQGIPNDLVNKILMGHQYGNRK